MVIHKKFTRIRPKCLRMPHQIPEKLLISQIWDKLNLRFRIHRNFPLTSVIRLALFVVHVKWSNYLSWLLFLKALQQKTCQEPRVFVIIVEMISCATGIFLRPLSIAKACQSSSKSPASQKFHWLFLDMQKVVVSLLLSQLPTLSTTGTLWTTNTFILK